ncbi:MAG: hypothetical protein ACYDC6_15590 [Acidobacteriaceae bacterium]
MANWKPRGELEAPALVGIEACGNSQWLIELVERLGHVVVVGDAAQIRDLARGWPWQVKTMPMN